MLNENFINKSFIDGLYYKPCDIKNLVESNIPETLRIVKLSFIIEKMNMLTELELLETIDYIETYRNKIQNSTYTASAKTQYLKEISNLLLGVVKFLAPWVIKLLGWLAEKVINTKIFGKSANSMSQAIKKITPDAVTKALNYAKDTYKNADDAFQNISKTIQQKVQDAFKGSKEKPPIIDANAIAKAHANLVSKIETWPGIGKIVSLGKRMGITPEGFYKFLAIAILSVLAATGGTGAAIILILYGSNIAAQRIVAAGKETGEKLASSAAKSMDAAAGKPPQQTPEDELDSLLANLVDDTPASNTIPKELEPIADKWAELLKNYTSNNDNKTATTKIKSAIEALVNSGELKKEQIKPLLNSVISKANANDDFKKAIFGALTDVGIISAS